jgi:hypothetical protein
MSTEKKPLDKTTRAQLGDTSGGKGTGNSSSSLQRDQGKAPTAESVTGGGAPSLGQ